MQFFDRFRNALTRYAEGVHLVGPPASQAAMEEAGRRFGQALPVGSAYWDFLTQWNGALLFHEEVVLLGVSGSLPALDRLEVTELRSLGKVLAIGSAEDASLYLDDRGRVLAVPADTERLQVVGSSFERWLDATMARGTLLYDRRGDFREQAFDGSELSPRVAHKRAEAGLRADPESPAWNEELGQLCLEDGDLAQAEQFFERVVALDKTAADAWFTLGRLRRENGDLAGAVAAFRAAGRAESLPEEAAFALAHAAQAARQAGLAEADPLGAEALSLHPTFVTQQKEAATHLLADAEPESAVEYLELGLAVAPNDDELRRLLGHARARKSLKPL
ncbi:MAG TPA: tetratricopeptide repeat protein [Polyangia bacterium]|jgi:tetratricopeptide (TPR) repeat protein|nr:tetratricopeptide repeat protein [Polyangia bacterium]